MYTVALVVDVVVVLLDGDAVVVDGVVVDGDVVTVVLEGTGCSPVRPAVRVVAVDRSALVVVPGRPAAGALRAAVIVDGKAVVTRPVAPFPPPAAC